MKKAIKWLYPNKLIALLLVTIIALLPINFKVEHSQVVIRIGDNEAKAVGVADYAITGVNDNVPFQNAINALPAAGGKIQVVSAVQINFAAATTVTRAINNVTIEGTGIGTYFVDNGVTPIFTAGGNNWTFRDFRTDAGGVNVGATTNWVKSNLLEGATFTAYSSQASGIMVGTTAIQTLTNKTITSPTVNNGTWANATITGSSNVTAINITATTVNATTLNAPTGRAQTYIIAASNASTKWKAQADLILTDNITVTPINNQISSMIAAGGGTLQLSDGTFPPGIVISGNNAGNLTLRGDGANTVITGGTNTINITGPGTGAARIHLERLTVSGASNAGVFIENGLYTEINNCVITGNGAGVWAKFNYGLDLHDNQINSNTTGVVIGDLSYGLPFNMATVRHNSIEWNTTGVEIQNAYMPVIDNNVIEQENQDGIMVRNLATVRAYVVTIKNNWFESNNKVAMSYYDINIRQNVANGVQEIHIEDNYSSSDAPTYSVYMPDNYYQVYILGGKYYRPVNLGVQSQVRIVATLNSFSNALELSSSNVSGDSLVSSNLTVSGGLIATDTYSNLSDHSWYGRSIVATANTTINIGQVVYIMANGQVSLAEGNSASTMPGTAIATATTTAGNSSTFVVDGELRDDSFAWTPGGFLYVSPSSAGTLTQTRPNTSGNQVQIVGIALSATIIKIKPDWTIVEVS